MRTTDERIAELGRRVRIQKRKSENRLLASLSAVSVMLFACLVGLSGIYGGGHRSSVQGLYGSTLLYEGAGAYVLVGVVAFAAAVVITVLCIRHRKKQKEKIYKDNEEEKKL